MRGKKSTNIQKKIAGTNQPCRMDQEIDIPSLSKLPPAPDYLSLHAKKFYNNILTHGLLKRNLINEFTITSWIFGCQLIGIWIEYSKRNKTTKRMSKNINEYKIARDSYQNAMTIFREFGLSPLTMTKIINLASGNKKEDPYEEFLKK